MKPLLFDTTIWIDYLNGVVSKESNLLNTYIENDYKFFLCPIIIQEVLQGIRNDKDYVNVRSIFAHMDVLIIDPVEASIGAAELYRQLRKKGVTIRKSNDCLIAFYAIYYNLPLINNDKDFVAIAKHTPLKLK